jgi:Tol biopolymer transport system component
MWLNMDIIVKKLNEKNNWQNLSSERRNQNKSASNVDEKILDSNGFEIINGE